MKPAPVNAGVEFDDFRITHTKSNLIQANEYYPFGLQTANSWTRENTMANNFLANGGTELNNTSNLYDLEFRNYDPALARMHQVDPVAGKYASQTPYNYSFNSPSNHNDPNGADPWNDNLSPYLRNGGSGKVQDTSSGCGAGGGGGGLFDSIWGGGFENIAGIPLGNQALYDYYKMSESDYLGKYAEKVYQNGSATNFFLFNPWAGPEVSNGKYRGEYVKFNFELYAKILFSGYSIKTFGTNSYSLTSFQAQTSNGSGVSGGWLRDHYFFGIEGNVSVGAQATFTIVEGAVVPVPYSNSSALAFKLNIGSATLGGIRASNREGLKTTTVSDLEMNQGFAASVIGNALEFNRKVSGNNSEYTLGVSILGGLLGAEINFTKSEFFIGMMPSASWTLIGGVNGSAKSGLKFGY